MMSLADQDWLASSATRAVMKALAQAGGPDCARFVGGCVRNAVLGAPVDDIDIATQLRPDQVVAALKAARLRAIPTGIEHGTVTALSEHQPYEITTLRRDVETDGRRATVAFTTDWAEDAARRDFRLNALYADADGVIHDPTGQGLADAEAGRIIFVGDARQRIREDYLRILRFFRFHAWYGRGPADPEALQACTDLAEGVQTLSAERVSRELLKLLKAADPRAAVRQMHQAGVLDRILGTAANLDLFDPMVPLSPDPLMRLSALWPDRAEAVAERARALRLSNAERDRLVEAVAAALSLPLEPRDARAILYQIGPQAFADRVLRARAAGGDGEAAAAALAVAQAWQRPRLPVGGRDLARLGLRPGPETGRILKAFEASWIADDFPDHGHEARLRALVASQA